MEAVKEETVEKKIQKIKKAEETLPSKYRL